MKNRLFFAETILGMVVSFLLCSSNASAQNYIGGSFSFTGSSTRATASATSWSGSTSISVAPDFGKFIGDKWAVGIRPTVGFSNSTNNDGVTASSFSVGINPYARYLLYAYNRFGLWAEADPSLTFTNSRSKGRDGVWQSNTHTTLYGVEVLPALTYQLNRHIVLETRLNLFALYLKGLHHVYDDGREYHTFSYGLQGTTKDVTNTLGDISIGFLYKF